MIHYPCPKCGAAMSSPNSCSGQTATCPRCGQVCRVPAHQTRIAPEVTVVAGVLIASASLVALSANDTVAGAVVFVGGCVLVALGVVMGLLRAILEELQRQGRTSGASSVDTEDASAEDT